MTEPAPAVVVLMGVSGVGKTTVGQGAADRLGWAFVDADDLHPPANVAKMRGGEGLTDADRAPWLTAVRGLVERALLGGPSVVVACSALKKSYRDALRVDARIRFVWLDAPRAVLAQRLGERSCHFAPAALLPSQLSALEPPSGDEAVRIDAAGPLRDTLTKVVEAVEA